MFLGEFKKKICKYVFFSEQSKAKQSNPVKGNGFKCSCFIFNKEKYDSDSL